MQEKKQIILATILTIVLVLSLILVASHNFIRDADKNNSIDVDKISNQLTIKTSDTDEYPINNLLLKRINPDFLGFEYSTTHQTYCFYYINPDYKVNIDQLNLLGIRLYVVLDTSTYAIPLDNLVSLDFFQGFKGAGAFLLIKNEVFDTLNLTREEAYINLKETIYSCDKVYEYEDELIDSYNKGYGAGVDDVQNIFPSFFGSIGDFFKKFTNLQLFGISLGSLLALLIGIGAVIFVLKLVKG